MLRLVDLPHVVEAEQHFGSPTRADVIERGEEDDLFRRGRLQWRPGLRHASRAHIGQHPGVAPERVVHRLPALHLHLDKVAVGHHRPEQLLRCTIRLTVPAKRLGHTARPRQAGEADILLDQETVSLGLVAFTNE